MKTPRQNTQAPRPVHTHARGGPALLAAACAALLTACAGTRSVTVSHQAMGLHLDLPPGFVNTTPDILRRHQSRRASRDAGISTEPMLAFDDDAGSRGCLISRLTTRDAAFPSIFTASQMALAVSGMQGQNLNLQNTPWPQMARGQSIGLGSDGSLPASPLAQTVVSSRAARLGPVPGWLVVTQQQWPASTGPIQGITRLSTLVTDARSAQDGLRQWWVAQCAAAQMPDYVGGYLDEVLEALRDARWQVPGSAVLPLAQSAAGVPQ